MRFQKAYELLKDAVKAGTSVMLKGPPGIGKSDMVRQLAEERGSKVCDIRLTLIDPVDLKGMPVVDREAKICRWYPPEFLPRQEMDEQGNKIPCKAIIFLDEISSAPRTVQACAYSLVLDREIGEYRVPDGVPIIAAGNRASDKGVVFPMPAPLRNRFLHIELEADLESWKDWAVQKNRVTHEVMSYLNMRPKNLFNFDPTVDPECFPTPRSWVNVSKMIKIWGIDVVPKKIGEISGLIGSGVATEFCNFVKIIPSLPLIRAVLDGENPKFPEDLSVRYAFCGAISGHAKLACATKKESEIARVKNVFAYAMNMPSELSVLCLKDFIRSDEYKAVSKQLLRMPEMQAYAKKFNKLISDKK